MVKLQCFTKLLAGTLWDGGHLKECSEDSVDLGRFFLDDIFFAGEKKNGPRYIGCLGKVYIQPSCELDPAILDPAV